MEYAQHCLLGGFTISEIQKPKMREVFEAIESGQKGVMVYGGTGTGKTLLFELIRRLIHVSSNKYFVMVNVLDVVKDFNIEGDTAFDENNIHNVLYDDIGTEQKGMYYGNRMEVMENLIQFRYNLFRNKNIITHFTTNLTPEEIRVRYGERCYSRLKEMCHHIVFDWSDMRRIGNFLGWKPVYNEPILSKEDKEWQEQYRKAKEEAKNYVPEPKKTAGQTLREQLGTEKWDKNINDITNG